ncbi:MAG: phage head morphogenesis protein [Bacteroidales bacterium]|nr:phage head morphogenesis protein [Bacteroidales bacterium]
MCQYCQPLIKAIDDYLAKADDKLKRQLEEAGFADAEKTVDSIEDVEAAVEEILASNTAYVISRASEAVDLEEFARYIWPDVQLNDELTVGVAREFKYKFETLMPELAQTYVQKVDHGLYVTRVSERTVSWIEEWSGELAGIMKLDDNKEIEKILTDGLSEGIGIEEFARRIRDSGIRDSRYKARRVAVTEVLRAHSVAEQEAFGQNPSVTEKMWRHSGAYRIEPRWNHQDMDGETVPKNEPFTLYGADGMTYYPQYPRDVSLPPGESINCHCIMEPVVDEAILGLSLEERQALQQQAIDEMDDSWEAELDAQARARAGVED